MPHASGSCSGTMPYFTCTIVSTTSMSCQLKIDHRHMHVYCPVLNIAIIIVGLPSLLCMVSMVAMVKGYCCYQLLPLCGCEFCCWVDCSLNSWCLFCSSCIFATAFTHNILLLTTIMPILTVIQLHACPSPPSSPSYPTSSSSASSSTSSTSTTTRTTMAIMSMIACTDYVKTPVLSFCFDHVFL